MDEATEIHQAIIRNFGTNFLHALVDIISKEYPSPKEEGILSVISALVSSQVDADRMDYLLRDSYFTAVSNGNYDLDRLIRSLGVEKSTTGNFRIFIHEKFMATLEEYILARYYMYKEVYQHPIKRQMEGILKKIFMRASELLQNTHPIDCHPILFKLMQGREIDVKEYLLLDDNIFVYHISLWQQAQDQILSYLCRAFLDRNKFEKIIFSKESKTSAEEFRRKINVALVKEKRKPIHDFSKEYFYMEEEQTLKLYINTKENVWIKRRNGQLSDLAEYSSIINKYSMQEQSGKLQRIYFSRELFELIYGIPFPKDSFENEA